MLCHTPRAPRKRLLQVLTTFADHDRAETYLETVGDCIGFYNKKGHFEVKERRTITDPNSKETFSEDGGMIFMVRQPRESIET